MTLFFDSKFDIGNKVRISFCHAKGEIIDVELSQKDAKYRVNYLVEFENRERRWMFECDLEDDVEE